MSEKQSIIKAVVVLVVICIVISGALAVVNSFTAPVSAANAEARETAARQELIPEANSFEQVTDGLPENVLSAYVGKASDGSVAGYVITASGKGFGGTIQVMVAISPEGTILRCKTLDVSAKRRRSAARQQTRATTASMRGRTARFPACRQSLAQRSRRQRTRAACRRRLRHMKQ